jgi:MFS family permease
MDSSVRLPLAAAVGALLTIAATYVVNAMDRIVFATLLPSVAKEYGYTLAAGGFLATIFTLGLGVTGIPGGFLLDRMSRKTLAIAGVCVYSICTALTCFSFGFIDMAIYRVASGVGEALQNAAIFTMAGAYFARDRTLAFGLLNVAYGIGAFIGPRLGGYLLAQSGSWRLPLFVYAAVGLGGALAILLLVPSRFAEWQANEVGAGLSAESHIPGRLINRNTAMIGIVAIVVGVAGYGYLGLYPTFLRTHLNFSVETAGVAAGMFGAGALVAPFFGFLGDRVGQKWMTAVALVALALIGYLLFGVVATPLWQNLLSFLEGAALSGCLYINNYSLMQRSVRAAAAGSASGLYVTCVYLPAAFSGYLFAKLVDAFGWGGAALVQMSLILAVPILAILFFDPRKTSRKIGR